MTISRIIISLSRFFKSDIEKKWKKNANLIIFVHFLKQKKPPGDGYAEKKGNVAIPHVVIV